MNKHQIRIDGEFETVAIALSTLRSVIVRESTESQVLVVLPNGAVAFAVATPDDAAVELTVVDATGPASVARLVDDLCCILGFEIAMPAAWHRSLLDDESVA